MGPHNTLNSVYVIILLFKITSKVIIVWLAVHWQSLKDAIQRDGISALLDIQRVRVSASARLLAITCT